MSEQKELKPLPVLRRDEEAERFVDEADLGTAIHALFESFGDVQLEIPPREAMADPVNFDDPASHDRADDCR